VRVLGEIPARATPALRAGTLRRRDLEAFDRLLEELEGVRTVLAMGSAKRPVALGLAIAAAARGVRTVLVECDLAEPTLAESLGLAVAPGLHEYLCGEVSAMRILKPVVLAGPGSANAADPLVCIAAGRPADDARALLASDAFSHVVDRLRSTYDLVVIDSPSLPDVYTLPQADLRIACVGPSESRQNLPVSADGVVIQN
jgi:Mrp family chromosome partitioning ATPase